jgi:glycosyltransferase involved in cell wall biosynthesis
LESSQINEKLQQYHFLFMPTKGENYGHIIVESLAVGVPVLISDKTPWRNLKDKNAGWDLSLLIPTGFVNAIEQSICFNSNEYESFQKGALEYAQTITNNQEAVEKTKKLFLK